MASEKIGSTLTRNFADAGLADCQGAPVKRFRVETWKVAANGFRLYQCYSDEGAALHVKEQLEWVGARVRIIRG